MKKDLNKQLKVKGKQKIHKVQCRKGKRHITKALFQVSVPLRHAGIGYVSNKRDKRKRSFV